MARTEGEIVIGHPVDVVPGCVADQGNEPPFNLRMVRPEKITAEPGPLPRRRWRPWGARLRC